MDIGKIASRIVTASQLKPPPVMFKTYMDFVRSAVGQHILDVLESKYGFRWSDGMDSDALTPADLAAAEIGYMLAPSSLISPSIVIPLDLTGWDQFSSLKVAFDIQWFMKFLSIPMVRFGPLLKHVNTVYPNVTQDILDDYYTTGNHAYLPWEVDLTVTWGDPGPGNDGTFSRKLCEIVIDPARITDVVSRKHHDVSFKPILLEKSITYNIESTAGHEFTHYTQHLMTVIVDLHKYLKYHDKLGNTAKPPVYYTEAGDVGKECSTDGEALLLRTTNDLSELFNSTSPPFKIGLVEHTLRDTEFESRIHDMAFSLNRNWKDRDKFKPNSSFHGLKHDKRAFGLELMKSELPYEIYNWCIEHAKNPAFKRRLQRRRKKYIEEVMEVFLR